MKNKSLYIAILFIATLFVACEDLDTYPEGSTITSEQQAWVYENYPKMNEAGLNAIYAQYKVYGPNYNAFGSVLRHNDFSYPTIMLASDVNGIDMVCEDTGYQWAGFSLDYSDRSYSSYECDMVWNNLYSYIYIANNILRSSDPNNENPTSKFFRAQALSNRAFSYFILAQLYQFNYVGNESKPCVPIVTDQNSQEVAMNGAPRATVKEVYDFILSDINEAVKLFTEAKAEGVDRKDRRYINLSVAYGLRARINLTMHNYAAALSDADNAIAASDAQPAGVEDVNEPAFASVKEKNWMWGMMVAETDDTVLSGIVNWISHVGPFNYGYSNYSGGYQINKALYNSISDTDVRKGWWLNEDKQSANLTEEQFAYLKKQKSYKKYSQVKFGPYKGEVGTSTNANDMPLMRIEEMYLIKAEAEAMTGKGSAALVDFVKQYRDPSYSFSGTSAEEIQEEVIRQRRIELWGEGLSWYDIMRLNKGVDRRGGGYPNATMVFNIPAGDPILLWRLPEREIQANQALEESDNNPPAPRPTPVADN